MSITVFVSQAFSLSFWESYTVMQSPCFGNTCRMFENSHYLSRRADYSSYWLNEDVQEQWWSTKYCSSYCGSSEHKGTGKKRCHMQVHQEEKSWKVSEEYTTENFQKTNSGVKRDCCSRLILNNVIWITIVRRDKWSLLICENVPRDAF